MPDFQVFTTIPLSQLRQWEHQPRIDRADDHVHELKHSILANDGMVLQNLIVFDSGEKTQDGLPIYDVCGGGTRLMALQQLAAEGDIEADVQVPARITPNDFSTNMSVAIAENAVRRNMKPIDEALAFCELASTGVSPVIIADTFGYTEKTVKKRLSLGRLTPAAQALIRSDARDLAWGHALSAADVATQNRIVSDISSNPSAWSTGNEVHRHLTIDSIPMVHALFPVSQYDGPMVSSLFEGDFATDRARFWELQDEAIAALVATAESEGWREVRVQREPVDLWKFSTTDVAADGIAIVQVLSNGKVDVFRGLVEEISVDRDTDVDDAEGDEEVGSADETAVYAGYSVRPTPGVIAYANDQKTAILQASLFGNHRASLEFAVVGLIGHPEVSLTARRHTFVSAPDARQTVAFDRAGEVHDYLETMFDKMGLGTVRRTGAQVCEAVSALDDDTLMQMFTALTAVIAGASKPKRLDTDILSVVNWLAERTGVKDKVREFWTPDQSFFDLMSVSDLRRIAQALLPADKQGGLVTAKKPTLARVLSEAFADASDNAPTMDAEAIDRLNAWLPGPLSFPAVDDRGEDGAAAMEEDIDAMAALFDESADETIATVPAIVAAE